MPGHKFKANCSFSFTKKTIWSTFPRPNMMITPRTRPCHLSPLSTNKSLILLHLDTPHTSLHAMLGQSFPETLCLPGTILNKNLTILIDGGSTHNFIHDRIVKFLGLNVTHANNFHVLVGNGDRLQCNSYCTNVLFVSVPQNS